MGSGPIVYVVTEKTNVAGYHHDKPEQEFATQEEAEAELAKLGEDYHILEHRNWVPDEPVVGPRPAAPSQPEPEAPLNPVL